MVVKYIPEKGDVIWIDFDPTKGHEQKGHRPALVISIKNSNKKSGLAICLPITTKAKSFHSEIPINGKKIKGVVLPIHIRSVDYNSKEREVIFVEKASDEVVDKCLDMLLMIFDAVES